MRLIDADTVKQDIYKYIKEEGRLINPYRMLDYIDSVETSKKAIPIEWIRSQKVDYQNEYLPFDYCRGMQDGYNACIDYLIDKWEDENEKDI